jgi:hypothetical protein
MSDALLRTLVVWQVARADVWDRLVADEEGEGVVSAAIAVLIFAFLGAAMWTAFNVIFRDASGKIEANVSSIGG